MCIKKFKKNNPDSCLFYINFNEECEECEECQECQESEKCDDCDNQCADFAMFIVKNFNTNNNTFYIFLDKETFCIDSDRIMCGIRGKIVEKNIVITTLEYCTDTCKKYKNNDIFDHEEVKNHITTRLDRILLPISKNYTYDFNHDESELFDDLFEDIMYYEGFRDILCVPDNKFYLYYTDCISNFYFNQNVELKSVSLYTLEYGGSDSDDSDSDDSEEDD